MEWANQLKMMKGSTRFVPFNSESLPYILYILTRKIVIILSKNKNAALAGLLAVNNDTDKISMTFIHTQKGVSYITEIYLEG